MPKNDPQNDAENAPLSRREIPEWLRQEFDRDFSPASRHSHTACDLFDIPVRVKPTPKIAVRIHGIATPAAVRAAARPNWLAELGIQLR